MNKRRKYNYLEKSIIDGNDRGVLEAMINHYFVFHPDVFTSAAAERLSDASVNLIAEFGIFYSCYDVVIEMFSNSRVGARWLEPLRNGKKGDWPPKYNPPKALRKAILAENEAEVLALLEKGTNCFKEIPEEEVIVAMTHLSRQALVTFLCKGLDIRARIELMFLLIDEVESPNIFAELSYMDRVMYANLLIHVVQGIITPETKELIEEDWYPFGASLEDSPDWMEYSNAYDIYFEPRHLFFPRMPMSDEEEGLC